MNRRRKKWQRPNNSMSSRMCRRRRRRKVGGCHCHRLGQSEGLMGNWRFNPIVTMDTLLSWQWLLLNYLSKTHKEVAAAATKRKSPLIDWRIGHVDSPVVGGMRCITLGLRHFTQAHTHVDDVNSVFFSKCSHKVDLFRQGVDTHTHAVQSSRFNFRVSNFPRWKWRDKSNSSGNETVKTTNKKQAIELDGEAQQTPAMAGILLTFRVIQVSTE